MKLLIIAVLSSVKTQLSHWKKYLLALSVTGATSVHAALPTVEGPKGDGGDKSFYGQIAGYLNDGIVLGGLILAAVAMLAVGNAIIATFAEVQQGRATWSKFGMLVVVGVILVVAVIWLATMAATVLLGK